MATSMTLKPTEFGDMAVMGGGQGPDYHIQDPLSHPSGFTHYTPEEMRVVAVWKERLAQSFQQSGFTPVENRPVEYAANLQRTGGIDKQIFGVSRLLDGSITKLGLPFDRTVPLAILLAANRGVTYPYSRYDIGMSWRGEHAQTGRYRAFLQADVDVVAPELGPIADAQCIAAVLRGLSALGVLQPKLLFNHVGVARCFLALYGIREESQKTALRIIDKLKPDNREEVVKEFVGAIPSMTEEMVQKLLTAMDYEGPLESFQFPGALDASGKSGMAHLVQVCEMLALMGIDRQVLCFAPRLARGLNYYTGVVFETLVPNAEKYGSIASGGRYDDLVGQFNPQLKLQGVGGSIGLTRLFDVMKAEGRVLLERQTTAQVFVGYRTTTELSKAVELASALRAEGIFVELCMVEGQKVGKQLETADKKGIPMAVLVMNPSEFVVKDMAQKKLDAGRTDQVQFSEIGDVVGHMSELRSQGKLEQKTSKDPV